MTGLAAPPAAADQVRARRLGKGVFLKEIKRRKPRLNIKIVSISPRARHRIRTVLGSGRLPGLERTSSMARRTRALAAINGDYARESGRPVMTFARGGSLLQTPLTWGRNFAMTRDGKSVYIGHPRIDLTLRNGALGSIPIKRVNQGVPTRRILGLFTNHGGSIERPPPKSCHARLVPSGGIPRRAADGGLRIRYEVGMVRCGKRLRPLNGAVVSALRNGPKAEVVRSLRGAGEVSFNWSLGWDGAYQTVGGNPTLIEDGRIQVGRSSDPFFGRHPRTGVGVTRRGRVSFVTVDGRQKRSRGMTLLGFARLFRSLGASWALNLDGGGSTTMVAKGSVMNNPSDGRERPVSSALVVLRRGAVTRTPARTGVDPAGVWDDIVADPASTGGLADSLTSHRGGIPSGLRSAARRFRALRGQKPDGRARLRGATSAHSQ